MKKIGLQFLGRKNWCFSFFSKCVLVFLSVRWGRHKGHSLSGRRWPSFLAFSRPKMAFKGKAKSSLDPRKSQNEIGKVGFNSKATNSLHLPNTEQKAKCPCQQRPDPFLYEMLFRQPNRKIFVFTKGPPKLIRPREIPLLKCDT